VSVLVRQRQSLVERHAYPLTPSCLIALRSRDIDEDAPHQPRRHREEVRAVLPAHVLDVEQTDGGLVDERRGLQTVADPFAGHTAARTPMQFRVNDGNQTVQRLIVAVAPGFEQLRDVV